MKFIIYIIDKVLYKLRYLIIKNINLVEQELKEINQSALVKKIALVGEGLCLNGDIYISDPRMLIIGSNVHIGNNAYFNTAGGLIIGDNVHISRNLTIYSSSHNYEGGIPYNHEVITKQVIIEKNVWIGMNVCITPGVTIGEGAIIGLGSVISKDVPPFTIVGNQPFKILKHRNRENYNFLLSNNIIGGINGKLINTNEQKVISGKELGDKLFFIVSTGRSGTTSLANILNQHPNIVCKHEFARILTRVSTQFAHNEITKEDAKKILREIYVEKRVFFNSMYFGESNQKLSNLIPILQELLPKAKFIWLIRNGKQVVDSTYARNWYSEEFKANSKIRNQLILDWHNYRLIGYKTGDFSKADWNNLNRFEKNCWYYSKWNQIIKSSFQQLPDKNKLQIHLENLDNELIRIKAFLDIKDNFKFEVVKSNIAKNKLLGPENWNNEMNNSFNKLCQQV